MWPGVTHALPSLQDLVKQVLSALRAIAGNDDVKDAIVRAGGTETIVSAMTRHLASPQVYPPQGRGDTQGGVAWLESQISICIYIMVFPISRSRARPRVRSASKRLGAA